MAKNDEDLGPCILRSEKMNPGFFYYKLYYPYCFCPITRAYAHPGVYVEYCTDDLVEDIGHLSGLITVG